MSRIFSDWLKTFRNSINSYSYYIDFKKVYRQAENIKLEINLLNSLVGSREIEEDFEKLSRVFESNSFSSCSTSKQNFLPR